MIRSFTKLSKIKTFEERYEYLRLHGSVGETTFGYDRYLNQMLYTSKRWRKTRDHIIVRDNGCDLGIVDYEIRGVILVHHINVLTIDDIENDNDVIYDPEFLICTSLNTHNAIHYGDESLLLKIPEQRRPNDTCPWR